jgi:threonyl-tRNA synthetase
METYGALPQAIASADIAICVMGDNNTPFAQNLARSIRESGHRVFLDSSSKKIGDKIKNVDRRKIPRVICIGDNEAQGAPIKIKDLKTGIETEFTSI